ncbi:MAG: putative ATP-dependent transporter ycf16 [Chlamydiota bacterium]|jgi:Fe-S cluster assembly ATP-binding protein
MLIIKNLHVAVEGKKILNGFCLEIQEGSIHAIMGPNGTGKSTLAKVLAGDPAYEILEGEISFYGKDILSLPPEERSHAGLFMSFQYPLEIPGISNFQFFFSMYNAQRRAKGEAVVSEEVFHSILDEKMQLLKARPEWKERALNTGFSGGEKKRNEILQMALLEPHLAILDETDSGLDIDAMKTIAQGVLDLMNPKRSLLLITHYQRLLDYIKPDFVHVMVDGRIVETGKADLALALEEQGYDRWILS